MVTEQIIHLVDQVSSIRKRYEKVAQATGENFNIFKILRLESQEVKHSRLLGELLNPKGSHGQGHIFLKLFLQQFEIDLDAESAVIEIEKYVGVKTEFNGGYIDILITDNQKRRIIIENKIYAGDQENQLIRYHGYDPNADIIYLTLDGSDPGNIYKERHQNVHKKLKLISYQTQIIKWLYECRKEAAVHPILRETLTQYINALKLLTGQSTNEVMNKEIVENLSQNNNNIESVFLISDLLKELKLKITNDIKSEIYKIGNNLNLEVIWEENWLFSCKGFYFKTAVLSSVVIGFEIENNSLLYGIKRSGDVQISEELRLEIIKKFGSKSSDWWPYWEWFPNSSLLSSDFFIEMKDGTALIRIEDIIRKMLDNLKQIEL